MIALTPRAAEQVRAALAERGLGGYALRVQVVGGGCEGFLYDLLYTDAPEPEDATFDSHGVRLVIDRRTLSAIDGLLIDHGRTAYGDGFLFENPRAKARCGCGASFSA